MAPIKQNYTLESHELPLISNTPSGETSGLRQQRKLATTLQRWTPLALSISSTALSSTPIILWWKHINFGPDSILFHVVSDYRNTVQVVISILALMLNLIWAYPLCALDRCTDSIHNHNRCARVNHSTTNWARFLPSPSSHRHQHRQHQLYGISTDQWNLHDLSRNSQRGTHNGHNEQR
jgi:hypothetical protein